MSTDWNHSILCSVLKKDRDITLLFIAYKVLTRILCERLKPITKAVVINAVSDQLNPQLSQGRKKEMAHENQVNTYTIFLG